MSDEKFEAFKDWADREGWSQGGIAEECITSRAHLNQVLTGARPGPHTWKRLVAVLPMEGLLLLKQCAAWNNFAEAALAKRIERDRLLALGAKCREPEKAEALAV